MQSRRNLQASPCRFVLGSQVVSSYPIHFISNLNYLFAFSHSTLFLLDKHSHLAFFFQRFQNFGFSLWLVKGNICLVYLRYLAHTSTVIAGHLHVLAGVPVVYVIYHENISQCPTEKIPHLQLCWAVCGDVCQMYSRICWLTRNSLILHQEVYPPICQVFGSQYSQVKSEGPLHILGRYQSVIGLGKSGILLVYEVFLWKGTSTFIYGNI